MGHPGLRPLTGRAPTPTNSEGFSEPQPGHRQSSKRNRIGFPAGAHHQLPAGNTGLPPDVTLMDTTTSTRACRLSAAMRPAPQPRVGFVTAAEVAAEMTRSGRSYHGMSDAVVGGRNNASLRG